MIGIIGAGISGLAVAHHLRRAGVAHAVFEASGAAGGVIRTVFRGGIPLELGPQRTRLTPVVRDMVDDLGLVEEVVTAPSGLPLYVFRRGRLRPVPLTPLSAVTSNVVPWSAKLRLLAEPFTAGAREHETVAEFFTRKLGVQAYEAMVGPLYGGLYASDPARMLVRHGLARTLSELGVGRSLMRAWLRAGSAAARSPACSFRTGMGRLPEALLESNREAVRLSSPVLGISSDGAAGYRLESAAESLAVRAVVLTTSAPEAADVLEGLAPDAAKRLRSLTYNPLAMVHLESDCPFDGLGYQVAFGESLETRGVTWNSSLFGRGRLQTAFLGGMKNPGLVELPAGRLGELACDEFRTVTGYDAAPLHVHRTRMPSWDVSWRALDGLELPPGIRLCTNYMGRPGLPGRLREARMLAKVLAEEEGARVTD